MKVPQDSKEDDKRRKDEELITVVLPIVTND